MHAGVDVCAGSEEVHWAYHFARLVSLRPRRIPIAAVLYQHSLTRGVEQVSVVCHVPLNATAVKLD